MPFTSHLPKSIDNPCLTPSKVRLLVAEGRRYLIRHLESDAEHIIRKCIGILPDLVNTCVTILLINPDRIGGTDAMTLQKHHYITDGLVLIPRFPYLLHTALAYAVHLKETFRSIVKDRERIHTESLHYTLCIFRPYAFYQSARQVGLYTLDCGRQFLVPRLHGELAPELRVVLPFAIDDNGHSYTYTLKDTDNGMTFQCHTLTYPHDGIAVVRVLVHDMLNRTSQLFHNPQFYVSYSQNISWASHHYHRLPFALSSVSLRLYPASYRQRHHPYQRQSAGNHRYHLLSPYWTVICRSVSLQETDASPCRPSAALIVSPVPYSSSTISSKQFSLAIPCIPLSNLTR